MILLQGPQEEWTARDALLGGGWLPGGGVSRAALPVDGYGVYRVHGKVKNARALFGLRRNAHFLPEAGRCEGEFSFLSHPTEYLPSMSAEMLEDPRVYACAVDGEILDLRAEKAQARTIFLAGDSTVADQSAYAPYSPEDSYCGWGQMLPLFLREDAICNQAHSGLTSRGFIDDGHFDIVRKHMLPGDLMLIQFGHNDQKRREMRSGARYARWLTRLIDGVKNHGGIPVLVSPASRVPGTDADGPYDLLEGHAQSVRALGRRLSVPVIDLHTYTYQLYCQLGENCLAYFVPGDRTHTNDIGAHKLASFVAKELEALGLASASGEARAFPQMPEAKGAARPRPRETPPPFVDVEGINANEVACAVRLGLLDPCEIHARPYEEMPRAEFIQLMFRALSISGVRAERAPYEDVERNEFDASYAEACRRMGLVDGARYRPDETITVAEARELTRRAGAETYFWGSGEMRRWDAIQRLMRAAANKKPGEAKA